MRLIDADALIEKIKFREGAKAGYREIFMVDGMPTIDAVPAVRCKDCVHAEPIPRYAKAKFGDALNCRRYRGDDGYGYAGVSVCHADDYCSDGERRGGELNDEEMP